MVSGKDGLVEKGQLQHAATRNRREAAEKRKATQDRAVQGASAKKTADERKAANRTAAVVQRAGPSTLQLRRRSRRRTARRRPISATPARPSSPAEARADAERLSELTEVRKRTRKQG